MKLSIVTPSYNQGQFIERTIRSVIDQGIEGLEYLVMDGGSKDETISILKKYDGCLRWVSERDDGQADAVNKAIRQTSGEIIGWINSDDIYYPGAFQKVMDFFASHPEAMVLYGQADHIDIHDKIIEPYYTEEWDYQNLLDVCFICQPAVFFRRQIVDEIGLLNPHLQYCMDYEYWIRIGRRYPMHYLKANLAGSRLYADTKTLGSRVKVHREIISMVYHETRKVPSRWIFNLGHVVAEEKGLTRTNGEENFQFVLEVCKTAIRAHMQLQGRVPFNDLRAMLGWVKHAFTQRRKEMTS
ncbi:glycosyltransferase [Heliobacterium gestii]|uniref:Glycosyltransferase n=2 Tax=Heliomicrobium gestii TaxID=2699 RepID=A0A845LA65_HELGE|nr:glycosyltransferase [Heliomicrobium gestii]